VLRYRLTNWKGSTREQSWPKPGTVPIYAWRGSGTNCVRIAGVPDGIRIENFLNTSVYHPTYLLHVMQSNSGSCIGWARDEEWGILTSWKRPVVIYSYALSSGQPRMTSKKLQKKR
jgi:hypothetical protein